MKNNFFSFLGIFGALFALVPLVTHAHVRYIADDTDVAKYAGYDWTSFFSPLSDPFNVMIIIITILAVLLIAVAIPQCGPFNKYCKHIGLNLDHYKVYLPWLIRIVVAIALIGGGTSMYFISPVLEANEALATIQIFIGFMLFVGFLIEPLVLATILLFIAALTQDMYLVGSLDFLALILVMLTIDVARPGVDDVLGIKDHIHLRFFNKYTGFILRLGIGFSMMFLALYEKVFNPNLAEYVVEVTGLLNVIPVSVEMWVFSAGAIEFVLGLLLILGFKTRIVSIVTFIVLSLSFFYFGEDVTSHITLFGALAAILITGPGVISADNLLRERQIKKAKKIARQLRKKANASSTQTSSPKKKSAKKTTSKKTTKAKAKTTVKKSAPKNKTTRSTTKKKAATKKPTKKSPSKSTKRKSSTKAKKATRKKAKK